MLKPNLRLSLSLLSIQITACFVSSGWKSYSKFWLILLPLWQVSLKKKISDINSAFTYLFCHFHGVSDQMSSMIYNAGTKLPLIQKGSLQAYLDIVNPSDKGRSASKGLLDGYWGRLCPYQANLQKYFRSSKNLDLCSNFAWE